MNPPGSSSGALSIDTPLAIVGAGTVGTAIAHSAALAGHRVRLFDAQPGAAAQALQRIDLELQAPGARGRLDSAERAQVMSRLALADSIGGLEGSGLVFEAIGERLEATQRLLQQLEQFLPADAVLATSSAVLPVSALASGLARPQRLVGLHFPYPASRVRIVEVVAGVASDLALVQALHRLLRAWGKTPVDAPNLPGYIVHRVTRPLHAEALRLAAERVASMAAIDRLMHDAGGFAMGPFELMDAVGIDHDLAITEAIFTATQYDTRYAPQWAQQELVRAGWTGCRSGRGFYDYAGDALRPLVPALAPTALVPMLRTASDAGLLAPLVDRLAGSGLALIPDPALPPATLAFDEVRITLTDGRSAAERAAADGGGAPLLLLDLARDYASCRALGATASPNAADALAPLAAALRPAGIDLLPLADVPGLVVMRLVCCIVNEAAELLSWSPAHAADIDIAMVLGAAFPIGPLAWGDALGSGTVAGVLAQLQAHYGDARFRRAPRLLRALHDRTARLA